MHGAGQEPDPEHFEQPVHQQRVGAHPSAGVDLVPEYGVVAAGRPGPPPGAQQATELHVVDGARGRPQPDERTENEHHVGSRLERDQRDLATPRIEPELALLSGRLMPDASRTICRLISNEPFEVVRARTILERRTLASPTVGGQSPLLHKDFRPASRAFVGAGSVRRSSSNR